MNIPPAQNSLWEAIVVAAPKAPRLSGPGDADVVVVGGGYAGLSCALHLAERGVAVTVLEAAQVGAGASGRNGGQVLFGGKQSRSELVARYVEAAGSRVHARRVLLATNGRPGSLWPGLNHTVLPAWSFQVATDPLPPSAGVLPGGAVVSDTRRVLRYFRRDREGRLVLGGKGTITAPRGPQSFELQRKTLARLYPQLADHPVRFYWGGQVCP